MLPTYNESKNIELLIETIWEFDDSINIVVVDDNSPDQTWKLVQELADADQRVHLVHRTEEKGRGSAGIRGFQECMNLGAEKIIEMDADFSHHPRFIPELIKASKEHDIIIGSRLVEGGGETGRNWVRQFITNLGNRYAQIVLGLSIKDCTSGYRVFDRSVFEKINLAKLTANGPAIVQEVLMAAKAKNCSMAEVPILFEERMAGESTFNFKILLNGIISVWKYRFKKWD